MLREIELRPRSLLGHNGLAFIYTHGRVRDYPSAERHLLRAVELEPVYEGAHENLMKVYNDTGRPYAAVEQARILVANDYLVPESMRQDHSQGLLELAVQTLTTKRFDDGVIYLEAFLTYHPENDDARALLKKAQDAVAKLRAEAATRQATTAPTTTRSGGATTQVKP